MPRMFVGNYMGERIVEGVYFNGYFHVTKVPSANIHGFDPLTKYSEKDFTWTDIKN